MVTNLVNFLLDIHKPCIFQFFFPLRCTIQRFAELCRAFTYILHPEPGICGRFSRAIIGEEVCINSLQLEVSPRDQVLEGALE